MKHSEERTARNGVDPLSSGSQSVAALFVQAGGAYYNLPNVDPWDEVRDADESVIRRFNEMLNQLP